MKKHNKKLYIGLSIILILFIFFIIFSLVNLITTPNPLLHKEGVQTTPSTRKIETPPLLNQGGVRGGNSVTLLAGNITTHLLLPPKTLLYDALIQEKKLGKISFSGKNYPGLGFFTTDIGTLHAGNGKNLLYYVNGKQASVGVSAYTLKDGDVIEWKLE